MPRIEPPPGRPVAEDDLLRLHLASAAFAAQPDADGRYLSVLAWCARRFPRDFAAFVAQQESGRRFLALGRDEVNAVRARNQARPIDGSPFWAVMTIDDDARRRFVRRLLEYLGCHDETVAQACRRLDPKPAREG
ncbi:MAG: hypothetical protein JNG83_03145 [Opitutaceae bacterium]|nr:hypothetical protein [Opitutaceae bacterium]